MACFYRQRCPYVTRGPHAVHRGFHCQLCGTHPPPRGAVRAAAAEAEVFPSQQVSPVAVGGWPLTGRAVLVGLPAAADLCVPRERGGSPPSVKLPGVPGLCFCFASLSSSSQDHCRVGEGGSVRGAVTHSRSSLYMKTELRFKSQTVQLQSHVISPTSGVLKVWSQWYQHHLRTCKECRVSGPTPDPE